MPSSLVTVTKREAEHHTLLLRASRTRRRDHLAVTLTLMTPPVTPTRTWQALVPELPAVTGAEDTAERLLLLLHYAIDWDNSWVAEPKHRKTYWDEGLPSRVRSAAYRAITLDRWWSDVSARLNAPSPRQRDRRAETAALLREPPLPVLALFRGSLPALLLRVRIITEAVAAQRKATRE